MKEFEDIFTFEFAQKRICILDRTDPLLLSVEWAPNRNQLETTQKLGLPTSGHDEFEEGWSAPGLSGHLRSTLPPNLLVHLGGVLNSIR